jgi:hypothetical protein
MTRKAVGDDWVITCDANKGLQPGRTNSMMWRLLAAAVFVMVSIGAVWPAVRAQVPNAAGPHVDRLAQVLNEMAPLLWQ